MKNIYKKIRISKVLLLIILISFISGLFKDILCYLSIIFFHELGHIITSKIYDWKIHKINFCLYGAYIDYDEIIDKSFKEEFIIAISGVVFQSIYFLIIWFLFNYNIIGVRLFLILKKYYLSILLFNLIQIIPLDVYKLIIVFLNLFLSYYDAIKHLFYISLLSIICVCFLFFKRVIKLEYSYIIVFSFLISYVREYYKNIHYLFNKFLYERYFYPVKFNKYLVIKNNNIKKMKRRRKHYFKINSHYYDERTILAKRFD